MNSQNDSGSKEREAVARAIIEEACKRFYEIDKQIAAEWKVADAGVGDKW